MMKVLVLACLILGPSVLSSSAPVCYLNEYTGLYYNPYYSKYPMSEAKIIRRVRSHRPDQSVKVDQLDLQNQQTPLISMQISQGSETHNNVKRALPFSKTRNYDSEEPYFCPICKARIMLQQEGNSNINEKSYNRVLTHNHQTPSRLDTQKLSPQEQFIYELSRDCDQHSGEKLHLDRLNSPQKLYDMEMKLLEGKLPSWEGLARFSSLKKSTLSKPSRADKKSKLSQKLQSMETFQTGLNYSIEDDDSFYIDGPSRYARQLESTMDTPPIITKTTKTEETAVVRKEANEQSKQPQETLVVTKNIEEIETNSPRGFATDHKVTNNQNTKQQKLSVKEEN